MSKERRQGQVGEDKPKPEESGKKVLPDRAWDAHIILLLCCQQISIQPLRSHSRSPAAAAMEKKGLQLKTQEIS